jgi:hypothetical protein
MAAEREESELIGRLELGQTNRTVRRGCSTGRRAASDGGEGEERERVSNGASMDFGRHAASGERVRVSGSGSSGGVGGGGGHVAEASAVEVAEEEAERDTGYYGDEEDKRDDEDARVHG